MRVVFLITRLDYSGGPKMLAWIANQFAKAEHDVYFIAVYSDEIGQPLEKNIHFSALHIKQSKNRFIRLTTETLKVQNALRKEIKQINPDLVIGFLYPVDLYFTLFNKLPKRCKVILSQRFDPYSENGITAKVKKKIISMADGVVFQTPGARDYYDTKTKNKSVVISNPVTSRTLQFSENIKSFNERENTIVLPARLDIPQKRQDVMINAFELVVKQHPEMRLVLLGNGPDKENLQDIINSKGLSDKASIHQAVPTAEEFTKDNKIVCLTSDFEGMPNSLIEAMALGLNVVATDCSPGGARMLIKDGKNGYLVNKGDHKALAERICYLLDNHSLADEMAREAKNVAIEFSEGNVGKRWLTFATRIIEKK